MRLRYLHLQNYPPIKDISVCFASGSPLNRECAIRFVVGVNGSGKSNLLRAVTEVFLALADQRLPPFPVTLVYELGQRGKSGHFTFVVSCPGNKAKACVWIAEGWHWPDTTEKHIFAENLAQLHETGLFEKFREHIARGTWPQQPGVAMPKAVLAYSTGDQRPWQSIWNRNQDGQGLLDNSEEADFTNERPAGWSSAQEAALQAAKQTDGDLAISRMAIDSDLYRRPILLNAMLLKCALLAVALPQALANESEYKIELQTLLESWGWHQLVSASFRSHLQTQNWGRQLRETAHDWLSCAGEVIAESHPQETRRSLFFDLKGVSNGRDLLTIDTSDTWSNQGEALLDLLGGKNTSSFELFTRLLALNQAGLFDDVLLRLRRQPLPEPNTEAAEHDIGILRYEELSDGEQMVLGRMALFHLLKGQQDALLLLDEPETHFNDKWKREIVDIIDDAIGDTANDVLISSHSAIVLSDVFNNEIIMLEKAGNGSDVRSVDAPTFAADPSSLMMTIFDADDSIGKRAQEFIENKLEQATGTPDEIVDLERLIARMGSGFYRSELRTLLNSWRSENAKAN
ncbi:conserved hypothetical protein [Shewanella baltica OS223]|uniref:AAA family ATPase n=1 Tax=Shewanella baltica TaxID=62322 RepID=UPI00015310AD|nr:AAA family ATPase [Shewanella baltica]ACK44925.1 conserved hypothetical protein [Shewanella baltica OS223]